MTAPTANVTAMYFDQRWASSSASWSSRLIARQFATRVMKAHDTPSGTRMMWDASVNAIWARAHGTGSTASTCAPVRDSALMPCAEPFEQVVADAQGVGHRRERRVHGADAREEAGVDHVEVVDLVGPAVGVEHRRRGVGAEPARAGLVGDAATGIAVLR